MPCYAAAISSNVVKPGNSSDWETRKHPELGMSDLIAADPDVPDGFHLRASRASIPPGGTVLGVLTLFDASSYQR